MQQKKFNNNEKYTSLLLLLTLTILVGCTTTQSVSEKKPGKVPFVWEAASVYFLMTDRFIMETSRMINFNRTKTTGKLRGFEGGDIKGIKKN
jgi:alpha-amylase